MLGDYFLNELESFISLPEMKACNESTWNSLIISLLFFNCTFKWNVFIFAEEKKKKKSSCLAFRHYAGIFGA